MSFQSLNEAGFRERFKDAFDLDETLTAETYYQILRGVDFDEQKALWKVVDKVRKPDEFLVPKFLLRSASPSPKPDSFSTPNNKTTPTFQTVSSIERTKTLVSGKKRLAPHPVEHSDDELTFLNGSQESTSDQLLISPFNGTPNGTPNLIEGNCFGNSRIVADEEDEDVRPLKRRARLLAIRTTKSSGSSRSARKQRSRATGSKRNLHPKSTQSSFSTSTLGSSSEESDLFVPTLRKHNSQGSRVGLLADDDLSEMPEADDDEGYDTSSEVSDDLVSPRHKKNAFVQSPKKRGNQNEMVLKHRMKTMATPWLHMLVSPLTFLSNME
jgi:hypothetical protein